MYCRNCGSQLPDGTKFCNNCGAEQPSGTGAGTPGANSARQPGAAAPKKQKKKPTNILITIVIIVAAFLLGKFVIGPALSSDSRVGGEQTNAGAGNSAAGGNSAGSGESGSEANPEYTAIFNGTRIFHNAFFFNMDIKSFAKKDEDGNITCHDFGYRDDTVIIYRETAYIDTTGYTDEQKQALEDYGKEEQTKYADVACRTVRYEMNEANSRFVITVEYTNLDKEENYSAVYAAGLLTSSGPYSMQVTTTLELEGGFIMK